MSHSNELYHYGVKGMKWGVRKDKSSSGVDRKSPEYKTARKRAGQDFNDLASIRRARRNGKASRSAVRQQRAKIRDREQADENYKAASKSLKRTTRTISTAIVTSIAVYSTPPEVRRAGARLAKQALSDVINGKVVRDIPTNQITSTANYAAGFKVVKKMAGQTIHSRK